MWFDICTINIRVSIRVRGFHLVFNWESQTPTKSRKNRNGNEIKMKVFKKKGQGAGTGNIQEESA
jgi:hypothetical protein